MLLRPIDSVGGKPLLSMKPASRSPLWWPAAHRAWCSLPARPNPTTWHCEGPWKVRLPTGRGSWSPAVEHASVLETARWLDEQGLAKLDVIPVTHGGFVDLLALEELIGTDVLLVSVMAANSETGVLNPVMEISEMAHAAGALVHCDATQAAGRLRFDLEQGGRRSRVGK